ncbi:uncharacterized protein LOC111026949, partial [Myzus persicae]|uniref:uncharacterized protein LOC111026949 n=1 Tax=Myzus persicae TaxID=13164 RepID=UPI000B93530D
WVVGYFTKENKYSVIPFTWILNCGNVNLSKWPIYGVVNSMIMEATYPELDWPTFPVKIVSQIFNTFEDAKMKEKELFLSASESESPVKKKRKNKKVYPAIIESESDSACSSTHTTPIKVMKTNQVVVDNQQSGSSAYVELQMNQISDQLLPNNIISSSMNTLYGTDECINTDYTAEKETTMFELNIQSTDHSMSSVSTENQEDLINKSDDNTINNLFKNVISILAYVKRLDSKIDLLTQKNNNTQISENFNKDFEKIFPLKCVEAVDDMENKLKSDENTSGQLRNLLQKIGGTGLKNFVKRVLERIFTNELSTKYSWTGFKDNHELRTLKIIKIMKDVANSTFSETEANFEAHIKDWFRHGSQRYAREQLKESS